MTYGYCRISTQKQSIERQIRNITKEFPSAKLYCEAFTGTTMERKEWCKLLKIVKSGDTIVFDSVSRMSRDADEGMQAYEELYNRGIELVFLKERHIDTQTYKKALENNIPITGSSVDFILEGINKYLMALAKEQIKLAFEQSEKEVQDLRQRTKEGLQTAKNNGTILGRKEGAILITKKSIEAKKKIIKLSKDFGGSLNDTEVAKLCGISRVSLYKYKAEIKAEESI